MRILQVVHGFPPDNWAGTELVTLYLSHALRDRGHEVTVFTRTLDPRAEEFSVREEYLDGMAIVRAVNNYTRTTTFRLSYESSFFTAPFINLLERVRPEVIHFQHVQHLSVCLIPLAVALGYPAVLSLHDFFFPCARIHLVDSNQQLCSGPEWGARCVTCLQGLAPPDEVRRRVAVTEQVLRLPNLIITPSVFLAQKMRGYFPFLAERLRAVPLGVKSVPRVIRNRDPGTPLRVLYAGVLLPHKGAHVLIEALKGLPLDAIEVSLYGAVAPFGQSYANDLRQAACGLPVRFYGAYSHDQISSILLQHDVLVMPMIWEETFSILTREALLAGMPVVAARRGALPEVVQDGVNGLLFEPENAVDLRHCLFRLMTERELLERLRSVMVRVKTMEEYAGEVEEIYADVVAGQTSSVAQERTVTATRQLVRDLSEENGALQQERVRIHKEKTLAVRERDQLRQERETMRQEWEQAIRAVRELEETVHTRETQLREREVRLEAIYASTTWKLYRAYAFLARYIFHLPSRVLKQWLIG